MFKLDSHKALGDYILRKLGSPVINVELSPEQLDDAIYDAIHYFVDRHYDGVEEVLTVITVDDFVREDGFVELPDDMVGVIRILDATPTGAGTEAFERLNYLIANSQLIKQNYNLASVESYVRVKRNIADVNHFLAPIRDFEYNKATNRLHMRFELSNVSRLGVVGYRSIDPEYDVDVYDDEWIKRYATALARVQWGNNLIKYSGQVLPGGATINAEAILSKGENDLEKTLEEFEMTYNFPPLPRSE